MSSIGSRLKALIKYSKVTQEEFAEKIGSTRGYISLIANGHQPLTMGILEKLIEYHPMLSIDWLLFGHGHMMRRTEVEEKLDVVEGNQEEYRPVNWVQELSGLLDRHEERIGLLEDELARLRKELGSKNPK